jgi:hypothetical protein
MAIDHTAGKTSTDRAPRHSAGAGVAEDLKIDPANLLKLVFKRYPDLARIP